MLEAIGRSKRVTFDGVTVRIQQSNGVITRLALHDLAGVEMRSATSTAAGYFRFVRKRRAASAPVRSTPEHDELCVWFSEWREGGFVRLQQELELCVGEQEADAS
jgi:hypothetical protein